MAPGFGNASIEPQRFTHDAALAAATPPPGIQRHDGGALIPAAVMEIGTFMRAEFDQLRGVNQTSLHASTPPYLSGGTMHVRYAGKEQEVGPGYRQSGTITNVQDGIVTQSTGRATVEYKVSDLTADARDPAAMEKMLVSGRSVQITVGRDNVHVASLERNHDLDLAQRHGPSRGGH